MTKKRRLLVAAILVAGAGLATSASARTARCVISNDYGDHYAGPCLFVAEKGGSFTLRPAKGGRLVGKITSVSVAIVQPGVAEVRGLTTDGANSRWGTAERLANDRACWKGSDFAVCAY